MHVFSRLWPEERNRTLSERFGAYDTSRPAEYPSICRVSDNHKDRHAYLLLVSTLRGLRNSFSTEEGRKIKNTYYDLTTSVIDDNIKNLRDEGAKPLGRKGQPDRTYYND